MDAIPWMLLGAKLPHTSSQGCSRSNWAAKVSAVHSNFPHCSGSHCSWCFSSRGLTEVWFSLVNSRPFSKQSSSLKKGRSSLVIVPIVWPGKNLGHLQWPQIETTWTPVLPLKNTRGLLLKKPPTTKQNKFSHKKSLLFGMDFEKIIITLTDFILCLFAHYLIQPKQRANKQQQLKYLGLVLFCPKDFWSFYLFFFSGKEIFPLAGTFQREIDLCLLAPSLKGSEVAFVIGNQTPKGTSLFALNFPDRHKGISQVLTPLSLSLLKSKL